jgi:hypothetical protein
MEASDLRSETLRRFAQWGLVPHETLPLIEEEPDLKPKSPSAVALRASAAGYVAALCFGAPAERLRLDLERFHLWSHLTSEEQQLFASSGLTPQARGTHSWLVESVQFMAWALNLCSLNHFAPCDEHLANLLPHSRDPSDFARSAHLRPIDAMRQEADTLYMLHWRAVENNLVVTPDDRLVLPRISYRRLAADWLIGTAEQWDEVALDT